MNAWPRYFISLVSPAVGEGSDYGTLSLGRDFGDFQTLARIEGEWSTLRRLLVAELLRRYTGEPPTRAEVRRFMARRGGNWAMITVPDLEEFCGQRELPLGRAT